MKQKALLFFYGAALALLLVLFVVVSQQFLSLFAFLSALHPYVGMGFLALSGIILLFTLVTALLFFARPSEPSLPDNDVSPAMAAYVRYRVARVPTHPKHPEGSNAPKDQRWLRTNLKLLDGDAMEITREIATKNFFVGAFAQNTSYGTTTSLLNNIRMLWRIYTLHYRQHHFREFVALARDVYETLPLSDFRKEELPEHIKPIIQCSFSNTLASLLPGGNLLTPFFMNLFLSGSTNSYITCLTGIAATRYVQASTQEERHEVMQQSMFEASFMLKEVVRECNPILSVTISKAVKKAGMDSLDTMQQPSASSGVAQDIVAHLANSLRTILRDDG